MTPTTSTQCGRQNAADCEADDQPGRLALAGREDRAFRSGPHIWAASTPPRAWRRALAYSRSRESLRGGAYPYKGLVDGMRHGRGVETYLHGAIAVTDSRRLRCL